MRKLLVILVILGFAATASAMEWDLYGSARLDFGNYDLSKEKSSGPSNDPTISGDGTNSDDGTALYLETISRIGASVELSDDVGGGWELGYGSANGIYTRLLYGKFKLGPVGVLAGQHYTPINVFYSNTIGDDGFWGDDNMLQTGMIYDGRRIMLRFDIAGFKAALIENNTTTYGDYTDVDKTIPKIELSYTYSTDMFEVKPYVGYQTYSVNTPDAAQDSIDIVSTVFGAAAKVKFGPVSIGVNGYASTNGGNFGIASGLVGGLDTAQLNAAGDDVEDSSQIGAAIHVGVGFTDNLGLGVGYGMVTSEVSDFAVAGEETSQTVSQYYLNVPIRINKYVSFTPEVGVFDDGELETDGVETEQGTSTYILGQLKINF